MIRKFPFNFLYKHWRLNQWLLRYGKLSKLYSDFLYSLKTILPGSSNLPFHFIIRYAYFWPYLQNLLGKFNGIFLTFQKRIFLRFRRETIYFPCYSRATKRPTFLYQKYQNKKGVFSELQKKCRHFIAEFGFFNTRHIYPTR